MIAAATVAMVAFSGTESMAQDYQNSYRFGVGLGFGNNFAPRGRNILRRGFPFGGTIGFSERLERPPYFAQFPPVYYNGIVPRPYGVSPYAAPPGITPVEMTVPVPHAKPQAIRNPYFDQNNAVEPVSEPDPVKPSVENKTTSIVNPYEGSYTSK